MIQMSIKKQVGNRSYTYLVSSENFQAVHMEAEKLSWEDVAECGLCQSKNLKITARIAGKKKFPYVDIKCLSCRGSVTFGKTQEDPDTYFLRKKDSDKTDKNGKAFKVLDWQPFGSETVDE